MTPFEAKQEKGNAIVIFNKKKRAMNLPKTYKETNIRNSILKSQLIFTIRILSIFCPSKLFDH